jgi:phosphotransacetylase
VSYFAAMMVNEGDADGLVTGHSSYSSVVKPIQLVDKACRSFDLYDKHDDSSRANVIRYSY